MSILTRLQSRIVALAPESHVKMAIAFEVAVFHINKVITFLHVYQKGYK